MGRPRKIDPHLPKRLRLSHGSYFHVERGVWTNLGKNLDLALTLHRRIECARIESRPIHQHLSVIKPLEDLRGLGPAKDVKGPGVYFLWKGDDLHYVGRSKNVANRVRYHRTPKMGIAHDVATALACDKFTSLIVEAVHIDFYRPPGNDLVL